MGFFVGLLVACVLSVAAAVAFHLDPGVSTLVGLVLGFVCTFIGVELDA